MTVKKILILIIAPVLVMLGLVWSYYYIKMAPFRYLNSDSVVLPEPPKNESWKEIKYFENSIPKGFPEDMPVDPSPLKILQSYFAVSYNSPPKDAQYSVYSYLTKKDIKESFENLKNMF